MEQYESGKQEAKEAITMVEKEISLGLSEMEYSILDGLCSEHGITAGQLLKRFSKDLIGRPDVSGYGFHEWTKEAVCAKEWFVHCGFGSFPEESLLSHFVTYRQDIGLFLQLTELIESEPEDRKAIREYMGRHGTEGLEKAVEEAEQEALSFLIDAGKTEEYSSRSWGKEGLCLEHLKHVCENMAEMWTKKHPEADMKKEIETLMEWHENGKGQEDGQKDDVWETAMGGRHVNLRLSERDYDDIGGLFKEYGVAAGQVFGRFAKGLVDIRQTGLSQYGPETDEAGLIEEWFASCQFGRLPEESLANYLVAYIPNADEFVGMSGFAGYIDTDPNQAMDRISIKEWAAEHPDANTKEELLAVKEWHEEEERELRLKWQKESEAPAVPRKSRTR